MYAINPTEITDARLTSSSIAASTSPEWATSTAYVEGDIVKMDEYHKNYTCQSNHTSGSNAATDNPEMNPLDGSDNPYWIGESTNRWAMFDGKTQTKSVDTSDIVITLDMGVNVDSIALFGVEGSSVKVTMTSPTDGVVYDVTFPLIDLSYINSSMFNWYFLSGDMLEKVISLALPNYSDATIVVTVIGSGSDQRAIGELVIGQKRYLGQTVYGTGYEDNDFSTKDRDTFGNAIIVERTFASVIKYNVMVPSSLVNATKKFLSANRATGLVYVGDPDLPESIIYGYYNKWSIVTQNYSMNDAIIQVEELN